MRDGNIKKSYQREINLQTKVVQDKKKYNRTDKHKPDYKSDHKTDLK